MMATVTVRKPRPRPAPAPPPEPPAPPVDRALVAAEQYWDETRRPFVCLLFLAPLLIAYEIGVLWLGDGRAELLRNGADVWMRSWLYALGVHQSFVLPLVVLALLLLWNFYGYFTWRVRPETLGGMLAESLIYAFALVVAGQVADFACRRAGLPTAAIGWDRPNAEGRPVPITARPDPPPGGSASLSPERGAGGEGRDTTPVAPSRPKEPGASATGASQRDVTREMARAASPSPHRRTPPPPTLRHVRETSGRARDRVRRPGHSERIALATPRAGSVSDRSPPEPAAPPAIDDQLSSSPPLPLPPSPAPETARLTVARAVTYVGAGIYEEVLFRLLLLPACYTWFRLLRAGPRASAALAVLTTSLMFALAHYVGPAGDALVPFTFCFRAAAGAFFAVLFVTRGFGVTVGAHAIYDLIVGVLWAA